MSMTTGCLRRMAPLLGGLPVVLFSALGQARTEALANGRYVFHRHGVEQVVTFDVGAPGELRSTIRAKPCWTETVWCVSIKGKRLYAPRSCERFSVGQHLSIRQRPEILAVFKWDATPSHPPPPPGMPRTFIQGLLIASADQPGVLTVWAERGGIIAYADNPGRNYVAELKAFTSDEARSQWYRDNALHHYSRDSWFEGSMLPCDKY